MSFFLSELGTPIDTFASFASSNAYGLVGLDGRFFSAAPPFSAVTGLRGRSLRGCCCSPEDEDDDNGDVRELALLVDFLEVGEDPSTGLRGR